MRRHLVLLLAAVLSLAGAACMREKRTAAEPPAAANPTPSSAASTSTPTNAPGPWALTAASYRGHNGERVPFDCPAPPTFGSVWGTDLYTDDSSVCTAAVHAGVINEAGGKVTIEIRPSQTIYAGSKRNGIVSADYNASWNGSFVFIGKDGKPIEPAASGRIATWSMNATEYKDAVGKQFSFTCAPNGTLAGVYGTDIYTDDSSVCTAAVHAGIITPEKGGPVTIEMRGAQSSFKGSDRNGVQSSDYGAWGGSFSFVK